jgi:alkylation response protein AidB-like acyl-CoA dehydrogenase
MDFAVSDAVLDLLRRIQKILSEDVYPLEQSFLNQRFYAVEPRLKEIRRKVQAAGLWAPQAPAELGGLGLPLTDFALVSEALGQSPLGHYLFGCQAPDAGNIEILHKYGTAEQVDRFLRPLVRGEVRSCFAMTEPDTPGSNPTQLRTRAVRDGDHYVIDGHKWFTSSADGAAFAVVMAVTEPDAAPHKRATMLLVPTDTPGYTRVRNIPVMGEANEGFASHAEVRFTGCRVPIANRLGEAGAGFLIAQERLGPGRIHHCMRWLGICERAFTLMCQRALSRQIDDGETLSDKQLVQAFIAESRAEIDAARLLVLRTAWLIDRSDGRFDKRPDKNQPHAAQPGGFAAAQEDVSLIKFHVAGVMMRVVDRAIQVHGALGITSDTVLAYFYAHERGARIYDGPDEVHKLAAARRILRRFAPAGAKGARASKS